MICRMKMTALLPDELVAEVRERAGGATLTESVVTALREWVSWRRVRELNRRIAEKPLVFRDGFTAARVREAGRRRRTR